MSERSEWWKFDLQESKELIKTGKKQKGECSVEVRGKQMEDQRGKRASSQTEEESGSPGGRREVWR